MQCGKNLAMFVNKPVWNAVVVIIISISINIIIITALLICSVRLTFPHAKVHTQRRYKVSAKVRSSSRMFECQKGKFVASLTANRCVMEIHHYQYSTCTIMNSSRGELSSAVATIDRTIRTCN